MWLLLEGLPLERLQLEWRILECRMALAGAAPSKMTPNSVALIRVASAEVVMAIARLN